MKCEQKSSKTMRNSYKNLSPTKDNKNNNHKIRVETLFQTSS